MFRATELRQRRKYDIFQKPQFSALVEMYKCGTQSSIC